MSLNIVLATSLMATVSCSDSKKSHPRSTSPELTGFWRTECSSPVRTAPGSHFQYFQVTEDGVLKQYRANFANTECANDAIGIDDLGEKTIELGDILSQSPWTVEFDFTPIPCGTKNYSTAKYEADKLYVAEGECGGEANDRCSDFTYSDAYSRMSESEIPDVTVPVSVRPNLCFQ